MDNSSNMDTQSDIKSNNTMEIKNELYLAEKYIPDDKTTKEEIVTIADFEPLPSNNKNKFTNTIATVSSKFYEAWHTFGKYFLYIFWATLAMLYLVYFGFAMDHEFGSEPSIRLVWYTCVAAIVIVCCLIWKFWKTELSNTAETVSLKVSHRGNIISWIVLLLLYIFIIAFIIVDAIYITKRTDNLVSLSGIALYILLYFITSNSPAHVNWRAVCWGVALQFLFAIVILRWSVGYAVFQWMGDRVTIFLDNASAGSAFLFGQGYKEHFFAFSVLPKIIFFSTCISVLYYLGVMHVVIVGVGWFLQTVLSTSAGESLNAAGNIFFGQAEVSFIIRPFVGEMTKSELHAVMTAGFATVSGSLMGGYISYGAEAHHLIAASVMSAPAALALSKLRYPEQYISKTTAEDVRKMPKSTERNVIEAASNGAINAINLVANIAVSTLAFISILAFLNQSLTWFGNRVDWFDEYFHEPLTFEWICSYLLFPFTVVMGIRIEDCRQVAKLIGIKVFTTSFIGYQNLGVLMDNRDVFENYTSTYASGSWYDHEGGIVLEAIPGQYNGTYLAGGIMDDRSEVMSQYAMCSLGDIGTMGTMLGVLGGMASHRKRDLSRLVLSAMLAGNVACFMTACVAGIFYQEEA